MLRSFLFALVFVFFLFVVPTSSFAKTVSVNCAGVGDESKIKTVTFPDSISLQEEISITLELHSNNIDPSQTYFLLLSNNSNILSPRDSRSSTFTYKPGEDAKKVITIKTANASGIYYLKLRQSSWTGLINGSNVCDLVPLSVGNQSLADATCSIKMPSQIKTNDPYSIDLTGLHLVLDQFQQMNQAQLIRYFLIQENCLMFFGLNQKRIIIEQIHLVLRIIAHYHQVKNT